MKKNKKTKSSPKIGTMKPKVIKKAKPVAKVFEGDELTRALEYAWDIFNRAHIPIYLLGETARQPKDGELLHDLEFIDLAVLDNHINAPSKKMLQIVIEGPWRVPNMNYKIGKDLIEFQSSDGVPIKARIIKKDKKFFEYADTVFYSTGEYRIANQWVKYWKVRGKIK